MTRPKFTRSSYDFIRGERVDWLDEFAENVEKASQKSAVQVSRERTHRSIQEQLDSVLNNNPPKHRTVEGIVKDMQDRVGLKEYLQLVAERKNQKVAQTQESSESQELIPGVSPDLQEDIKSFIENKIETHRGQISIPAVQFEVLSTFREVGSEEIDTEKVARFINDIIAREQKMTSSPKSQEKTNLGKGVGVIDVEEDLSDNDDFMGNLMPNSS